MTSSRITRRANVIRCGAVVAALTISGLAVSQASYSAFSATTSNSQDSWTTGKLALSNDKASALFTATNLVPGTTDSKVITVSSTGSTAGPVKLYATGGTTPSADAGLGSYLNISVQEGTVSSSGGFTPDKTGANSDGVVYTGTLADFIKNDTAYASGVGVWSTAGTSTTESKSYKISYTLSTSAPNTVQGQTSKTTLVWEVQAGQSS